MLRLPMNRYCIENRSPDISTNFYLTAAFSLAAGMEGVEKAAIQVRRGMKNLTNWLKGAPRRRACQSDYLAH